MKSRAITDVTLIDTLKQSYPWSFIEEIFCSKSFVDEILTADDGTHDEGNSNASSTSSTKGMYPFMISAVTKECDFETTYNLAILSVELLKRNS